VVDALQIALKRIGNRSLPVHGLPKNMMETVNGNLILVTAHRREGFGGHLHSICRAISEIADKYPRYQFVYPVHPNPNVKETAGRILGSSGRPNVHLVEPMGYLPFVYLMSRSKLLLTDSGGIQEEAPYLGKPVLVMRDATERPEAVEYGNARVIGTSSKEIVAAVSDLLDNGNGALSGMAHRAAPFGDGLASGRILEACASLLNGNGKAPSLRAPDPCHSSLSLSSP
jgi:UDP-N-acetylglucosamine 2-epimerase (non-hydrolysing)